MADGRHEGVFGRDHGLQLLFPLAVRLPGRRLQHRHLRQDHGHVDGYHYQGDDRGLRPGEGAGSTWRAPKSRPTSTRS